MKNLIIFCLYLSPFFLLVGCNGCRSEKAQLPMYVYIFEKNTPFDISTTKELIGKFIDEKDMNNLIKSSENKVYFTSTKDLNINFEHDLNNGNFTFNKALSKYMGEYIPKLPSSEEARKISLDFLTNQKILPRNKEELKLLHEGGLRTTMTDGKKQGVIIDKILKLTYGRILDSLPVIGSGSKIVIKVGENGEILGLIYRWREFNNSARKRIDISELISQETAELLAKQQISKEFGKQSSYKTNSISRVYYDNNGSIIQPVYSIETTVNLGSKNTQPFTYLCIIPMLKNSPEPIILNKIDPRSKELIRNIKKGYVDSLDVIRRKYID